MTHGAGRHMGPGTAGSGSTSHVTLLREQQEYRHSDDVALYGMPALPRNRAALTQPARIPRREDGDNRIRIGRRATDPSTSFQTVSTSP